MLLGARTIADNIREMLKTGDSLAQPELAKRMGMSPKTFWTLKEGSGNPQLENLEKAARFFRRPVWHLLVKDGHKLARDFDPFSVAPPSIEEGHVRILALDAAPSAGPGRSPVDYPAVLGHIDVAEAWARKHLGRNLDSIRALPVSGDSMSPTLNEGDLAFVDIECRHFEADGIYVIIFNETLFIKRLVVDFSTQRVEIRSDNERVPTRSVSKSELNELVICGRVKAWLSVKGY